MMTLRQLTIFESRQKIGPYGVIVGKEKRLNKAGREFVESMLSQHRLISYFASAWPALYRMAAETLGVDELACELNGIAAQATITYRPELGKNWPSYVCWYATRRIGMLASEQKRYIQTAV